MTKQHFIEFANQIRAMRQEAVTCEPEIAASLERDALACESLVSRVAFQFNTRFDRQRFLDACYLEGSR